MSWIGVDWGTTNMRAWRVGRGGVTASGTSGRGMGTLTACDYEAALLEIVAPWLPDDAVTDVVCCGMAGAKEGWADAGYAPVPHSPGATAAWVHVPTQDRRMRVHILSGLRQDDPPDVMRGEETQIAGLLDHEPGFAGTVCLPGTHTKWVAVERETVHRFVTAMSGELFSLMSSHSILRRTVEDAGWDDTAFGDAVLETFKRPEALSTALFGIRAMALSGKIGGPAARARLSGLLIGVEMAETRRFWQDGTGALVIIGNDRLSERYLTAFKLVGRVATIVSAEDMTLAGLAAARRAILAERTEA